MTAKVAVLYYSTYGHLHKMAEAELEGVLSVEGVEGTLLQIPEILSAEVLAKMYAPPKADVPLAEVHDLPNYDGLLIGFPTRFGMPAAQFKAFWDGTGGLWKTGALLGKAASFFVGTASQGGGQETTHLTAVTQAAHHGMVYVPTGYNNEEQFQLDTPAGGSAYGAGTLAGPTGARQPSEIELASARRQGKYFAEIVKKLAAK